MILLLTSAWKASSSRKSRIQESLCPHQGPTHQPRSQTAWHPGLPSCGGHCSCPVLAAALPHIAHPFPEYMRPRFLWMEYYCRFFLCQRAAPPAQVPEIHKRLRLLMICLFISCFQSCSFHICRLHKNLCPCVATFLSLSEIILRLYIK